MKFNLDDVIADHYGPRTAIAYDKVAFEKFWAYPEALNALATDVVWSRTNFADSKSVRILDIGAGTGNASRAVVDEFQRRRRIEGLPIEIHLTMFDESSHMLEQAANKMRPYGLRTCDLAMGRLQDANWGMNYDLIISSFAIHHLLPAEKEICISRILSSLRVGGVASLLDKMWIEPSLGKVPENNFLRVAASKFFEIAKKNHPELTLDQLAEAVREGFETDNDRPSSLQDHLGWFSSVGFADVQNPYCSFAACVVSGQKLSHQ